MVLGNLSSSKLEASSSVFYANGTSFDDLEAEYISSNS